MITRPTTLILGAGASAPFGFPTGCELLSKVLELGNPHKQPADIYINPLLNRFGHKTTEFSVFQMALAKSGKGSVDAFLEHRPDFIPIGKVAMAIALMRFEYEAELFRHDKDNWYQYLFNQLNTNFEDFDQNKLGVLTFNYDRSLEHYLFTSLVNAYGKSEDECADRMRKISIIHLHGDLGALPFMGNSVFRPYNNNDSLTFESVSIASARIKIIHEGIENQPQFEEAKNILSKSEVICFLGFGYHPTNLERLGFCVKNPYPNAHIYGSTYGLKHGEINLVSSLLSGRLNQIPDFQKDDVLGYLRESGVLFLSQ